MLQLLALLPSPPHLPRPLSYTLTAFWRLPLSKRDSKSSVVSWGPSKGTAGEERGPRAPPTRARVKREPGGTVGGSKEGWRWGLGETGGAHGGGCLLPATWAEVVDDGALLLAEGGRGPLVAQGLAEGLWFRGDPLWRGGHTERGAVGMAGVRQRGEGGGWLRRSLTDVLDRFLDDFALHGPAGRGRGSPCRRKGKEIPWLPQGPAVPR